MKPINKDQIRAIADEIRDMLGEDFDDQTFWDTLDGETDAGEILDRQIWRYQTDQHLIDSIKEHEASLRQRRQRIEARVEAGKRAILLIMDAVDAKKVERPCATISKRAGTQSVTITDEGDVPSQLCRVVSSPDKTAIKKALLAGETVPGCELTTGPDGITIRTS